jgi:hypothetical protein
VTRHSTQPSHDSPGASLVNYSQQSALLCQAGLSNKSVCAQKQLLCDMMMIKTHQCLLQAQLDV